MQEIASSLQRGLRSSSQGSLRRYPNSRPHDNIPNPILRPHISSRACKFRRYRSQHLRVDSLRYVNSGNTDRYDSNEEAALRRYQKSWTRQHSSGSSTNRNVHIFDFYDNRWSFYPGEAHDSCIGYCTCECRTDDLSNDIYFGFVEKIGIDSRADTSKAWKGNRNFFVGYQFSNVGYQYVGKIESRVTSGSVTFLWSLGVDDYYSRFYATRDILPVSQYCLSLRGMEKGL